MQWTAATIGEALDRAVPPALTATPVHGFSIDSRTLEPGQCFIAIKGPRFDGHDFVGKALDRGAALCVVSEERCPGYPSAMAGKLLGASDTLEALHGLARFARRRWGRPLIGVTGSAGKTTTKDMIAAVLATRFRVHKSEGNLNNEYGLPLSLLRLDDSHKLAVLEMGMAHRGELARLCAVAEPNVGVVLNVVAAHLEFFSSVEEIAQAKRELIEGLTEPATAVLNADDRRVISFAENFSGTVLRFGFDATADVRADNLEDLGLAGSRFEVVIEDRREPVTLRLPGRQHVANALAACAVAALYQIELAGMREALESFEPASMRGEVLRFDPGFTVVNDAYNSNPAALAAMVAALSRTPDAGRRLLVAGEMKELGPASPELHEEAGHSVAAAGNIDYLAGVIGDAHHLVDGAVRAGFPAERAQFFETKEAAGKWLCNTVQPGDWVLLKASRGVALETLVESLRARFAVAHPAEQGRG